MTAPKIKKTLAERLQEKEIERQASTGPSEIADITLPEPPPSPDLEVKTKPPPSLIGLIEEVLEAKTKNPNYFRPSMLAGCDRANVFHYTQAPHHPPRMNGRMQRILDNGEAVHKVVQGYLADHREWFFAPETRVFVQVAGMLVRGSCDGVLIRRSDGYRFGIEIKTINSSGFSGLRGPLEKHVFQASIYARLMGLDWIKVLYWDKDKQGMKEYDVAVSQARYETMVKRVVHLKQFVTAGTLPPYDARTCDTEFCHSVDECRRRGAPV